jgi:NTP pyrophosphatase (non-canonical NTP hydrolase)
MTPNYRTELVQVAAACLAAAQVADVDTTSLGVDNEGVQGRFSLERLLDAVREERRRQEVKWGARNGETAKPAFWLEVILEEVGEVAEEIVKTAPTGENFGPLAQKAIDLGKLARARLEMR